MIPEIDFQDFDVSERDGEEATGCGVRRSFIPGYAMKNGKAVLLDSKDEPSVFDAILEKAHSLEGDTLTDFIGIAVLRMVMVLDLFRVPAFETFAKAWILDTLDERVVGSDPYNDRWYDHVLHPRLSRLAKSNPSHFRTFQSTMSRFVSLSDLSSQNPVIYRKRPS